MWSIDNILSAVQIVLSFLGLIKKPKSSLGLRSEGDDLNLHDAIFEDAGIESYGKRAHIRRIKIKNKK